MIKQEIDRRVVFWTFCTFSGEELFRNKAPAGTLYRKKYRCRLVLYFGHTISVPKGTERTHEPRKIH
ncbi:MAG TPA: hypothetical protein VF475_14440 [Sphingobium sp.]